MNLLVKKPNRFSQCAHIGSNRSNRKGALKCAFLNTANDQPIYAN